VIGCSERCERLRLVARFAPAIAPSCSEVDFISAMFSLGRKQISDPRADGLIFWPEVLVGREFVGAALGCPSPWQFVEGGPQIDKLGKHIGKVGLRIAAGGLARAIKAG
jgi:hypothetical protein